MTKQLFKTRSMCSLNGILQFIAIVIFIGLTNEADQHVEESYATSVAGMVKLLQLETDLIDNLGNYAFDLEQKLNTVKRALVKMRTENNKAISNKEDYLSNPLNSYSLIRRMHEDWIEWKAFMEKPVGWTRAIYMSGNDIKLPSKTDMDEACAAMHRIQMAYELKAMDIASGVLGGKQYNTSLSALDTYKLGQYFQAMNDLYFAKEWFRASGNLLVAETPLIPIGSEPVKVLHMYARAFFQLKYYSIGLPILDEAMRLGNASDNSEHQKLRAEMEAKLQEEQDAFYVPPELFLYDMGCRGQFIPHSNLSCKYKFGESPFLRLAPLKMEILDLDPYLVVFYDVLSTQEISELQTMARRSLQRSTVLVNRESVVQNDVRSSKMFALRPNVNKLAIEISSRITDMTEMVMSSAESLQIMNYGIGGHYNAHYDFFNNSEADGSDVDGDRIATVLFYLNKVEQGGATVLPHINQAIQPQPGMAAFWYNLYDDGTPNVRSLHGACPVLVGSKWIMTQWIRVDPQMFIKPCFKPHK